MSFDVLFQPFQQADNWLSSAMAEQPLLGALAALLGTWSQNATGGRGWVAIALVIFAY
jgi:ABC-type uncharacterized transport system permease subunit